MASRVKAFSEKRTNPARPYPDLRTWKAAVFSITVVVKPALHLRLLLLRAGDIQPKPGPACSDRGWSIRCDASPIVRSSCQRLFHTTCRRLTQSQNGIQSFVCILCAGGVTALPPTTTVTSSSARYHADVYSDTQRINSTSIPSCVNGVPTSHAGSTLASPLMWLTPSGCVPHAVQPLPPSLPLPNPP